MSGKEEDDKKSKEPDYDEDKDQIEEKQEEEAGGLDDQEKLQIKFFELVATLSFCNSS